MICWNQAKLQTNRELSRAWWWTWPPPQSFKAQEVYDLSSNFGVDVDFGRVTPLAELQSAGGDNLPLGARRSRHPPGGGPWTGLSHTKRFSSHIFMYIHMHMYMYIYTYIYVYVIHIDRCIYVYIYIYIHKYKYMQIYIDSSGRSPLPASTRGRTSNRSISLDGFINQF